MSLASPAGVAEVLTPSVHNTSIIIYLNFYSLKELKIITFKVDSSKSIIFMKPKVWHSSCISSNTIYFTLKNSPPNDLMLPLMVKTNTFSENKLPYIIFNLISFSQKTTDEHVLASSLKTHLMLNLTSRLLLMYCSTSFKLENSWIKAAELIYRTQNTHCLSLILGNQWAMEKL